MAAAAGQEEPGPSPEPADDPSPEGMQVERVRLDDGRALLLFTWDDPA